MSVIAGTNKITVEIDYAELLNRFQIFKIKNNSKNAKEYQRFYFSIRKEMKPLAHSVGSKYTLIACGTDFNINSFQNDYEIVQLRIAEIQREQKYLLVNLINSLLARSSKYFEVESDAYGLYYIAERKTSKITALKITIDKNMLLRISAVNFMKTKNKKDKDRYIIKGNKLVRSDEYREDEIYFKKGNYITSKTSFNFFGTNLKEYKNSKIFILNRYLSSLRSHFGDMITIRFEELQLDLSTYDTDTRLKQRKQMIQTNIIKAINEYGGLHIANLCKADDEKVRELQKLIMEYSQGQIIATTSDNIESKKANITITFDEDYYKKHQQEDVYKKTKARGLVSQNITTEVLKKLNETLLHVLLKELVIKHEISAGKMVLPQNYSEEKLVFVYPEQKKGSKEYIFTKIEIENQKMEFTESSSFELAKCREIAFGIQSQEILEAVVFSQNDINYIVKTSKFILPDLQKIEELRVDYEKPAKMDVDELIEIFRKHVRSEDMEELEKEARSKEDIFTNTIDVKSIKISDKKVKKAIEELLNIDLTFNLRRKEHRIVDALMAIRFNEEHSLYTVGVSGNVNQNIAKANLIREVRTYKGGSLLKPILGMLDEYFVRNGQFTVLPFPLKYCREYYNATLLASGVIQN